ncbi:hypothetical protein HDU82_000030 [Entophlyctis luteolus]|nr:hypothetical protein HDU82_000030 [Entophlyctis luteolus]
MPKRFVNVDCAGVTTRIDVTDMEDLSELQDAIKKMFGDAAPAAAFIQLWAGGSRLTDLDDIPAEYSTKNGPSLVVLKTPPLSRDASSAHLDSNTTFVKKQRTDRLVLRDLTMHFQAFKSAQLLNGCIFSPSQDFLPYSENEIAKIFVRVCYKDVFALLMKGIESGSESFAISGTSGVGKSLFFIYILYRLMEDKSKFGSASALTSLSSRFNPKRIVYQTGSSYHCYDLEYYSVSVVSHLEAGRIVREPDTLYIIDGSGSEPASSSCITLFIASSRSSRSDRYKGFVKQKSATQWYFPTWTLDELESCSNGCYLTLPKSELLERYRVYGGVARYIFHPDYSKTPEDMEAELADLDAVNNVRNIGKPTDTLHHIVVSDDGLYRLKFVDIASKYVGEQLWEKHSAQMITNLQEMLSGSPNEISRHLFEIYGHRVFSRGGRTLKCRNLSTDETSELKLDQLDGERIPFGKDSVPAKPVLKYYEASDDVNFRAIDSLSPQGMFQFTAGAEHPIRGVAVLKTVCLSFDHPKLYFVVPPHRFQGFSKQKFLETKYQTRVNSIAGLEQYVLELPVN